MQVAHMRHQLHSNSARNARWFQALARHKLLKMRAVRKSRAQWKSHFNGPSTGNGCAHTLRPGFRHSSHLPSVARRRGSTRLSKKIGHLSQNVHELHLCAVPPNVQTICSQAACIVINAASANVRNSQINLRPLLWLGRMYRSRRRARSPQSGSRPSCQARNGRIEAHKWVKSTKCTLKWFFVIITSMCCWVISSQRQWGQKCLVASPMRECYCAFLFTIHFASSQHTTCLSAVIAVRIRNPHLNNNLAPEFKRMIGAACAYVHYTCILSFLVAMLVVYGHAAVSHRATEWDGCRRGEERRRRENIHSRNNKNYIKWIIPVISTKL